MSDTTFETLFEQVQKLTLPQRLRMIELLAVMLQTDWHTALKATYSIFADDPIERPPQLALEAREPINTLPALDAS